MTTDNRGPVNTSDLIEGYAVPGSTSLIDCIHPVSGLSLWAKETFEQIKLRYPGAVRVNIEEFAAQADTQAITQPVEITEETFWDMLEVLPPKNWNRGGTFESFQMIEHETGNITGTYCRIGRHDDPARRYFTWKDVNRKPAAELQARLLASDAYKAARMQHAG